jgi:thymidylate synthase (FAD)
MLVELVVDNPDALARLIWVTPNAEQLLVHMARVSNPSSQADGSNPERLIRYLVRNKHWSPFEMVSACFEINTTRDIARQILRHRSLSFQELSQRYTSVDVLTEAPLRDARLQDSKNRQNSLETDDQQLRISWEMQQRSARSAAETAYQWALDHGIAKEVARAVLPEGLTPSRMYASGTIRSWFHYCELRTTPGTQKEHREIAQAIKVRLHDELPSVFSLTEEELGC